MSDKKDEGASGVRTSREIKQSLLRRAFAENRGAEVIRKILEINRRVNDMPEGHAEALELAKQWDGMAKAVRALNTTAYREGIPVVFTDEGAHEGKGPVVPGPKIIH